MGANVVNKDGEEVQIVDSARSTYNELFADGLGMSDEARNFQNWYNTLDENLSDSTKDYLVQNYFNEASEKRAWARNMEASNTQYQRAVADLKAAGLNPFLALQSLSGSAPSISQSSNTGGLLTSVANSKRSSKAATTSALLAALALIAVKVLLA